MSADVVHVARCAEHGLHGQRDECFVCGGPVEQVPMVPATAGHPAVVAERDRYRHALTRIADAESGHWGTVAIEVLRGERL